MLEKLILLIRGSSAHPMMVTALHQFFWSRIPWLYVILVSSCWGVAIVFMDHVPVWLGIGIPVVFTTISVLRAVHWWRGKNRSLSLARARTDLTRLSVFTVMFTMLLGVWSISLFRYASPHEQGLLAVYVIITLIGCVSIFTYLRILGLTMTIVINMVMIVLAVQAGNLAFLAIVFIGLLVSSGTLSAVWINYKNLEGRLLAQAELLRKEEAQLRLLRMFDEMPISVITADQHTLAINYVNQMAQRTLRGCPRFSPDKVGEIIGLSIDALFQDMEPPSKLLADPARLPYHTRIHSGPQVFDLRLSAITDQAGGYIGPMLTFADITQEAENEERIQQLALYDSLTGLANRAAFLAALENCLATPGSVTGLLYIDLDGFKVINDAQGHGVGDELLKLVADRLREVCGQDNMMLGRIGGDEFVVLLRDTHTDQVVSIADALVAKLSDPYTLGADRRVSRRHSRHKNHSRQRRARIGASIGCAIAPDHGQNIAELLSRADMALYAAKNQGKGRVCVFSSEMEAQALARLHLETQLREALEHNSGLFVFYQPIIDIQSRRATCHEALMRWHHPQLGWVPPDDFIPVAEDSGLIDLIGQFALARACRAAAGWPESTRVAVNISANQLGKKTLVRTIKTALEQSGLPPDRLEIEITETALIRNTHLVVTELQALKKIGVRIALDDFGTGFSSFTLVRDFPFDKIKIDGSFISEAINRADCAAIVNAMAQLGKALGITIVAERVETQEQLDFVTEAGCTEAQGYLFAQPAPGAADAAAVEQIKWRPPPAINGEDDGRNG